MLEVQGLFYVTEEVGRLTKPNDVLEYITTYITLLARNEWPRL